MTYGAWEIVGRDTRELPIGKTIGDALRDLIRKRWPHHTAKKIEAVWSLDPKTAKNVVSQGNVSERTLTKAALAERWALWMALGEELFGESYAEWEEQRLTAIIEGAERDLENVRRLGSRAAAVSERSFAPRAAGVVEPRALAEPADGDEGRRGTRAAVEGAQAGLTRQGRGTGR